jgi:hypothetical protein
MDTVRAFGSDLHTVLLATGEKGLNVAGPPRDANAPAAASAVHEATGVGGP